MGGGEQFHWALGDLKVSPTSGEELSQIGGLKFSKIFLKEGKGQSLFPHSKLNSTFLLKVSFSEKNFSLFLWMG